MNLDDLRIFCAVAQHRSFSGGAKHLGLPAATVSRRIVALEKDLASTLLHRHTRSVQLSDMGLDLFKQAAPLIEELGSIEQQAHSRQQDVGGRLRLQIPLELFGDEILTCLLGFQQVYPAIQLECQHYVGANHHPPEEFDLTLIAFELNLPSSSWIALPLLSLSQGIFAAPSLVQQDKITLSKLTELNLIARCHEQLWHFRHGSHVESLSIDSHFRVDSLALQIQAAINGVGAIKAPNNAVAQAVRAKKLRRLPTELPPVALSVALYYRSRAQPQRVKVFMDYLQRFLANA